MSRFRTLLAVACCALAPALARKPGAEDRELAEKVGSARCASRCLALHIAQLAAAFRNLQSDDVLGWCENHRRCSQCLQPCKELWETRRVLSHKACEKQQECVASAEFLASVRIQRQGDCPAPQRASGFAAACVESCAADHECTGSRKCCSNGCGQTCQIPANLYKGVPMKPKKDLTFLEDQQGQLTVTWVSRFNVSVEPVLYILQKRWNYGIHPSEDEATPWQTVLMTMEDRAVLKDVRPHRWYQFRVCAVNSQGTRGFTTPSRHFFSSRDPLPPERPRNVRRGNFSVQADGTVSVLLLWDPAREEDLPVHHYKVTWSTRMSHRMDEDKKENSRVTGRAASETELKGLQPNTAYKVQIQAIAYWGQKRLKSAKSQLTFITAPAGPADRPGQGQDTREVSNELPSSRSRTSTLRLEAAAPHYHNDQLQVKVFWKKGLQGASKDSAKYLLRWYPDVCAHNMTKAERNATVQGTHFVITGLLFACKYRVLVRPLFGPGERSEAVTSVTTPPCAALKAMGVTSLSCTQEEHPSVARKVLLRPEKLRASFRSENGSLQGVFSWQVSHAAPGQNSVTGFQFSWAQVSRRGGTSSAPNALVSQTQILGPVSVTSTAGGKPHHLYLTSPYLLQCHVLSSTLSALSDVPLSHNLTCVTLPSS
ncbi:anosmin-1-like isoform X2 [Scleropages formosus]|uniref:anosmin-1-like isoform X2 n=1 Tax=Scleropages formosus TaxID=113540 RepID=UPI0010FA9A47|nr:anosmin-1-like isoform X2 [Scleropages formosus]